MSVETVLKQLYTFVSTLFNAHTDQVSKWDERSLKNAFNWAKYAEEMHMKLKDRSFIPELDSKIKDMTIHLSPPSCFQMCFDNLEKASELLFWTLLQNPYFPEYISRDLFLYYKYNPELDRFDVRFDAKGCSLAEEIAALRVSKNIVKSLSTDVVPELFYDISSQAKCLLNALSNVISRSEDESRINSYVTTLLKRITEFKHGLSVIVCMYLHAGVCKEKIKQEICTLILQCLTQNVVSFENVPLELLMKVSSIDCHFVSLVSEWLLKEAKLFTLWYPDGELYTWKGTNDCFDFQTLCQYFDVLLKTNNQTRKTVTSMLQKLSEESLVNIYKDILKKV